MKISVITAVYNVVGTSGIEALRRCVESVAKIEVPHQHIIKDGGSTDGTLAELYLLSERVSEVKIISGPDNGIYDALNIALEHAVGDWIYVIGADDWIVDVQKLERIIVFGGEQKADLVGSPVMTRDDGSSIIPIRRKKVCTDIPIPHQGLLMKREVITKLGGFDTRYRIAADYDLELRAILSGARVEFVDEPYTFYSTTGLSNRPGQEFRKDDLQIIKKIFGLSDDECENVYPKYIIPLRVIRRYLFSSVGCLRVSAWYQLGRYIANMFGLIGDDGIFILNRVNL